MKRDPKLLVEFGFVMKDYYRDYHAKYDSLNADGKTILYDGRTGVPFGCHEVKGVKTLKLFISWWLLANNRGFLLYGYVRFKHNNETWIWQNPKRVYRGGWQLAQRGDDAPPKPKKPEQLNLMTLLVE